MNLGQRGDLWEGVNGIMGNHPPLEACLMQTVRWMHQHHGLSININKSSFSLCDAVDKLKGIECGRAGLRQYIPVMSLIKLEKSSKDDYELIMIWWPSKACLAQSPVTLLVESVPSINRACNSNLKTYNVKIRWHNMLERLSWSTPCGQNCCCLWPVTQKLESIY